MSKFSINSQGAFTLEILFKLILFSLSHNQVGFPLQVKVSSLKDPRKRGLDLFYRETGEVTIDRWNRCIMENLSTS